MKKISVIALIATMTLTLSACGNKSQTEDTANNNSRIEQSADTESTSETESAVDENVQTGDSHILIAYFSVMETDGIDTMSSASRVVKGDERMGNNEYIAKTIQKETGGNLFQIKTVQDYPTTHDDLLEYAYDEKSEDARPELEGQIENLDQYDTIFIGYPNWNADLPMPLYTFFEEYDFSGKTIIPFTSHGGSGFSRTVQTISELQPDADISNKGLSISRNDVADSEKEVTDWVKDLGL